MTPDRVLVVLIVLAAVAFIARRIWRTAAAGRSRPGCGGGDCGCGH